MRLFVGLELPPEIKDQIAGNLALFKIGEKGWEHPHDYHLTLLFLGETPEDKIPDIKERMKLVDMKSFQLTLGELAFFNRRILYVSLAPSEELLHLKQNIEANFPEWVRVGEKPFIPHITVKRWQRYEHPQLSSGLAAYPLVPLSFEVEGLALFKSEKDQQQRKYHVLSRTAFKS